MTIHVTPIPRLIDLAAPSFTLGTANAAGSAETAVASDSTLLAFDGTLPDAITFGQSGAVGSATVTARRDHAHAMATLAEATQAQVEAETATEAYVPPDLIRNSPGVAKAWTYIIADGTLQSPSYNIASVGDDGTGDRHINFTTAFSSVIYSNVGGWYDIQAGGQGHFMQFQGLGTTGVDLRVRDADAALVDAATFTAHFGDQ